VEFYENGKPVGVSKFTDEDAKAAGLAGDNWSKYRRNMHFARAISNGAKWFCPDVFGGPVYTPDELGAPVDGDGDIIDVKPTIIEPEPQPEPHTAQAVRPLAPEAIRDVVRRKARWHDGQRVQSESITEKQIPLVTMLMADAVQQDGMKQPELDNDRHDVLHYLVGVDSTKSLTKAEASAIIDWLKNGSAGQINQWARAECAGILKAVLIEAGQQEMQL
jgi:hypothetical protein